MSSGEVNKGKIYDTETKISQLGYDSCSTKMVPPNTVVIALAGQGKTRGTVAITKISLCTNQSLCSVVIENESINSDYVFYYLKTQYQQLRSISSGDGTRGGLNLQMIRNYRIPIPPLSEQKKIVSILDKFDALVNDISIGLPAEIEARRKQYEYYRNRLLTFKNVNNG
jgi:type I restriction enzyme S subunit